MDSATWWRTPAAVSAASRLRPEVWKNSSTALSSNEGELVRSITTCAPARASLSPSPVMLLTPVFGEAARTSWPCWRRMRAVFEPIRPVPPMMTIFIPDLLVLDPQAGVDGIRCQPRSAIPLVHQADNTSRTRRHCLDPLTRVHTREEVPHGPRAPRDGADGGRSLGHAASRPRHGVGGRDHVRS